MKGFYLYPLIGVLLGVPIFFNMNFNLDFLMAVNNVSLIFHFSFLSYFIIRVIPVNAKSKIYFYLFSFVFLFLIILGLVTNDITKPLSHVFAISSFGLTVLSLVYFYLLFEKNPILKLLNEPSFWIISGIFFAMSLYIPVAISIGYVRNNASFYLTIFSNVLMFCYGIMHLFFLKGIYCALRMSH